MTTVAEPAADRDEAQWLRDFFANARDGFFVEVGVRPASRGSLTWPLEAAGWNGVLVEPQPDVAAFLVTARTAKVFATACVAPDEAGEPLMLHVATPLASVDIGQARLGRESNFKVLVPTRTLDDVLTEAEARAPIDLLTLDAHGLELDALLGFDFARWQPRLVVVADPAVDLQRHRFLTASGYRLVRRAGGSGWYVPADSGVPSESGVVWLNYYLPMPLRKVWNTLRRFNARILSSAD